MKKITSLFFLICFYSALFAQIQDFSSLKVGEKLTFLDPIKLDTVIFIHNNTKDTIHAKGSSIPNKTDQLLIVGIKGDTITLSVQTSTFSSFKVLKIIPFVQKKNKMALGEIVYKTSLELANKYHTYKLRQIDDFFNLEICRMVTVNGNVEQICKTSEVPLYKDSDCNIHFMSVFSSILKTLYPKTTANGITVANSERDSINTYINSPIGINKILDLCHRGKSEDRKDEVENRLNNLQTNFANQLTDLDREDAGIMVMKEIVPVYVTADGSKYERSSTITFKPQKVWFKTSFHHVSELRIDGILIKKNNDSSDDEIPFSIINSSWGLSIDDLIGVNNRKQAMFLKNVKIGNKDFNLKFHYGEILDYIPKENSYSKLFNEAEYQISLPDNSVVVKKKNINDFVSVTIFSDFFGFIDERPNNILQTEVSAYIPVNRKNKKRLRFLPEIAGTLNFSVVNGFGENGKFVKPNFSKEIFQIDTIDPSGTPTYDTSFVDIGSLNAVEFLRSSDIDFSLRGKVFSFEFKKMSSYLNVEFGYRLFRAKVDTDSDPVEVDIKSKFIHSPDLTFSFDIKPDWILGANIQLGTHYFTTFQTGQPNMLEFEINDDEGNKFKNRLIFRNEFNVYAFINSERKNGVFVRYRGYYGIKRFGVRKKRQYFPSILIGYSTNLGALYGGGGR